MKILITGSMGFISRNLIEKTLLHDERIKKVYGIDHIDSFINSNKYHHYKYDLSENILDSLPNELFDVDLIVHTAGIPSPKFYKIEPFKTMFLNYDVTRLLLERMRNDTHFIYFSSSEIYGDPDALHIPTKETYNGHVSSIGDRSCYDESKRLGETICYLFKNYKHKTTKIIRPFNFYGNYMKENDNRIIPKFISQAINNENITVFNKGEQTRSYCNIDDAVHMIKNICLEGKSFVYNVGNMDEEITANKLAKKILEIVPNTNSKIIKIDYPNEYPKDEPMRRCPNIDKYYEEFKEKPKINLKTGLYNFYQYAKKNW
jgi:UDP-glucuronate decarboxylase